ncbi:hypothetical protein SAICODRAFT_19055 [Saitoella complicata NRRL Y-17804]|uniref:GYF domain-containing protein n=1 Tax=Saitoella complicata (strain BCRC 22490 / CBS 7301 / JCM 7358 / NBRC 10748 / NRRL Y-17804) TaxID=698492 RepID=A0A0E9N8W9_SAICN|nr:uncharacterized protein SAICODRAFT_19055 [Saitoella complicata NRRL Y-17804]ODQ53127.1 hypothetical protein SAICODRAFT_19055 [Saitoella complicata NRRL Y-17804]GAO46248.1 hypothetical protein G7K_0483-t1 [Saitoella complicata NRRL Y-17804]
MSHHPSRPKRPAEPFIRSGAADPSAKRPRFDPARPANLAPDTPTGAGDLLEYDLDGGQRGTKRNAVNLDGYDSDSSTEGHGLDCTQPDAARRAAQDANGEVDMFADEPTINASLNTDTRKAGQEPRFLDINEIEGQEMDSRRTYDDIIDEDHGGGSGVEAEEDDEGEVDPEIGAGGRKKGAPKVEAFNMKDDLEEGKFDEAGNFIRNAPDEGAKHDAWLEGVSRKDIQRAREAQAKAEREERERTRRDDAVTTAEALEGLIKGLQAGETVLEALQRLNAAAPKKKVKAWQKKKQVTEVPGDDDEAEKKRKEQIAAITGYADKFLQTGESDVYDETREALIRRYQRETGDAWVEKKEEEVEDDDNALYEYRWPGKDEVYGPYKALDMAAWSAQGYFGEGIEARKVGETDWRSNRDVTF